MLTASVIGCGRGGGLSLGALSNSSEYELLAAADPSADAREHIESQFPGVRLFSDYRDMLTECHTDVVCLATPAPSHASIAQAVLSLNVAGMLLEKPLACQASTAEQLLKAVRCAECPVVVPHGMLILPAAQDVQTRIRRGDIGQILSVKVQNSVDMLNGGIHWLAYLLDVFDDDCPLTVHSEFDVSGREVSDGVQVESHGMTRVEFQSGMSIELESGVRVQPETTVLPPEERQGALFRLSGSAGVIELSAWAGSYWIQVGESDGELVWNPLSAGMSYHQLFLEQLARDIAAGRPDYRSAELSLAALRLIETAYNQQAQSEWSLGIPAT
ncbi:MAG: Gfo/Idh/MocA family oxidoreductase [Woeseiaceae bacterium]|nr:Gfo/Idh/MocA family oxidoreductase [Woeseiaceae bacterium]